MRLFFSKLRHPIRTWREVLNDDDKLHVILGGMALALVVGVGAMIYSSSSITDKATEIKNQQEANLKAAEEKAGKAEELAKQMRQTVDDNIKLNAELWAALKKANPKIPVPQIVEPEPEPPPPGRRKPRVIIVPPSQTPAPIVKPTPEVKWRTKYLEKPPGWPFWKPWPPATPTPKPKRKR